MSGIYLHIPFCKQACHYCNFHFSTSLKHKAGVLKAMEEEMRLFQEVGWGFPVETLYFGGGTPSLLSVGEIAHFIGLADELFGLGAHAEITLEANPDDLTPEKIKALAQSPVNRLSIGVQSFDEGELRAMNRAHTPRQALECLEAVSGLFDNFSVDLIYGIPGSNMEKWALNLSTALGFRPPHISAYAMTVEPSTALHTFIEKGISPPVDEEEARAQFEYLADTLEQAGYDHYETSNFGFPGYYSRNNSAYWQGKPYLGIGPAAHSFDGRRRWWNPAHNLKYNRALEEGVLPREIEELTPRDRYNEAVMTGLRSRWGVSLARVREDFGPHYEAYLMQQARPFLESQLLFLDDGVLYTGRKGKFLADGIASDLFMINLK
ncbi:radical SAM family heme chaperone HemW [Robiginitalea marina]|uniref:Heme chaperone HemW n=1 Tax=Robiginitalea marina TaxID=2954105 RepID=A0ABT1AYF6_9FLAO|nr:radical SAM family heme chaperone HemW [Robiginitalea marina]MCO5724944.1 radical SAM family heme chaperone HemW [Robiginitalea marina]